MSDPIPNSAKVVQREQADYVKKGFVHHYCIHHLYCLYIVCIRAILWQG